MFKTKTQILTAIIFTLSAVSFAFADTPVNVAVKALSQKLRNDLAVENVNLKLGKVERQFVSKSEVRVTGAGVANNLPIKFDVKVNVVKQTPLNVEYNFVDTAIPTAAADTEEVLTKNLLNKLNKDYKTENIVVSIDGFDATQANGAKIYKGTGDVRLGFDWSKISFDVAVDEKTGTAKIVKYEVHQ